MEDYLINNYKPSPQQNITRTLSSTPLFFSPSLFSCGYEYSSAPPLVSSAVRTCNTHNKQPSTLSTFLMKPNLLPLFHSCCPKFPFLLLPCFRPSPAAGKFFVSMSSAASTRRNRRREKLVVIMGATGAGKSKLSIDLATKLHFEIINSDKIQVYKGLDITTNKISLADRKGVPHHLLGDFDSSVRDLSPLQYRHHASSVVSQIVSRRNHPLLVGGSNSFIYALLSDRFDPESDLISSELRYRCCFLWVDVSLPVLNEYLMKRVDEMMDLGMLEELAEFYSSGINDWEENAGLRKAIGVPEFERYFRMLREGGDQVQRVVYEEAVRAIKEATCQLAKKQIEKIVRLRDVGGWELHRLDATDAFRETLEGSEDDATWRNQVLQPSIKIVKRFLDVQE